MSTQRAHQKRLEKKKKEREHAKRQARARQAIFPTSMAGLARRAAEHPFGPAFMSASWRDEEEEEETDEHVAPPALVSVVVTRVLPNGEHVVAGFLIDRTLRGVKDALVDGPMSASRLDDLLERLAEVHAGGLEEVSLHEAQSVVLHAEAFARSLGIAPHSDFAHAKVILGEPETLLDTPLCHPSQLPNEASDPADDRSGAHGLAADIVAFAEPLLVGRGASAESTRPALELAMTFWSLAVMKDDSERAGALEDHLARLEDETTRAQLRSLANAMIDRHRRMFPEMHEHEE